jgi:hypothetical protein
LPKEAFNSPRSKPILQNWLVLHRVEFGDLAEARITFALQYGSSAKNSFNSSNESARAIRIPPAGGIEGPGTSNRPLSSPCC